MFYMFRCFICLDCQHFHIFHLLKGEPCAGATFATGGTALLVDSSSRVGRDGHGPGDGCGGGGGGGGGQGVPTCFAKFLFP